MSSSVQSHSYLKFCAKWVRKMLTDSENERKVVAVQEVLIKPLGRKGY